ncbi:transcription termination factor 5, mitochondrial [Teleopsis dalmanni]|uniref:transcription termination factor 5, mitochondrial n=1 Tax=Teleopsis dalmanni TaxID=139649 RepID=UPI0018CC88BC|nr:transcription termination factor 5, mitochondrial [Teleopsis dalmanni]
MLISRGQEGVKLLTTYFSTLCKTVSTYRTNPVFLNDEILNEIPSINPFFLAHNIGSSHRKWQTILEKYPELKSAKRKDVINSANALKAHNYTIADILAKPMILHYNATTIENRYSVLTECGFSSINISILSKYVTIMNKRLSVLKMYNYIPQNISMLTQLKHQFASMDLQTPKNLKSDDTVELKVLRQNILNCYLRQRLGMNEKDLEKHWTTYSRVRHKSFQSVQKVVDFLENDLLFPRERIIKNGYLLYAEPENIKRIITEIKTIDGIDIREIVYRRPKILMSTCDALLTSMEHVKKFGIKENAILRCLELLTLSPDTILGRLRDLHEIDEFKVLATNPRVLRLVHYQNKARLRLEYLEHLKVRCASLHILSCGSDAFVKFAREGSDRTKGRDIIIFLSNILKKDGNTLRNLLSRHPNWCHIPVIHIQRTYECLTKKKFSNEQIYKNVHLLFYPIQLIEEKLSQLKCPQFLAEMHLNILDIDKCKLLSLVLYFIECEFHFTGDGIWTETQIHQVENFNNLLPDFPEGQKVYKFGAKPTSK